MTHRIQFASDLHLEFPANRDFLKQHRLQPVGEVLVLAGDIVPYAVLDKHPDFFSYVSDHFESTFWLPGNHEYYHFDISEKSGALNEKIRSNITLVNNVSVEVGTTKLIFSTLWSKISPANQWKIERNLNDFRLIKNLGLKFSAEHYNRLHEESFAFLQQEVNSSSLEKKLVFTHHCPTFLNYPPQYRESELNEAFAVELYDWIEGSDITAWVYGHHHVNTPDFRIGNTRLLTNQLGYVQRNEHSQFEQNKCI